MEKDCEGDVKSRCEAYREATVQEAAEGFTEDQLDKVAFGQFLSSNSPITQVMKCAAAVPSAEPKKIKKMLEECSWDVQGAIIELKMEEQALQERLRTLKARGVSGSDLERRHVSKVGEGGSVTEHENGTLQEPKKLKLASILLPTASNSGVMRQILLPTVKNHPANSVKSLREGEAQKENQESDLPAPNKIQAKRFSTPRAIDINEEQVLRTEKLQVKRVPTSRATEKDDKEEQVLDGGKSARYKSSIFSIYILQCAGLVRRT